ncbi:hypothetical protein L208DRAFT_761383 [Tricholoma matsutake]|nr:hypothetical protein L208DRAFT_761383 [Tricholoma matsutake 945]
MRRCRWLSLLHQWQSLQPRNPCPRNGVVVLVGLANDHAELEEGDLPFSSLPTRAAVGMVTICCRPLPSPHCGGDDVIECMLRVAFARGGASTPYLQ